MQQHTSLTSLYTALVDARNGYREAVKDAERANLRTLFQDMIALHEQALGELRPELQARGERPDDQGSFMSTVNETVVSIRSAVTGLNQSALGAFASGEERILKNYDKAIDEIAKRSAAHAHARKAAPSASRQGRRHEERGRTVVTVTAAAAR